MKETATPNDIAGGTEGRSRYGRDDWIRTSDPLTPSQVRYQAAPHPDERIVPVNLPICQSPNPRITE